MKDIDAQLMMEAYIEAQPQPGGSEERAVGDDEIQARVGEVVQKYLSLDDNHPMSGDPQYVSDVLEYVKGVYNGNGDPQNQYEGWTQADLIEFDKQLRSKMEEYLNPDDLMYM
jgi:hypothetical protein